MKKRKVTKGGGELCRKMLGTILGKGKKMRCYEEKDCAPGVGGVCPTRP